MARPMNYCPACGVVSQPVSRQKGSIWMELFLWLLCGVGVFYSLWRITTRAVVCAYCGNEGTIPASSPRALADQNRKVYEPSMPWLETTVRVLVIVAAVLLFVALITVTSNNRRGTELKRPAAAEPTRP